jgi:hypothetical protein
MLIQDHRQLDLELESLTSSTAWPPEYSICTEDVDDRGHHGRHLIGSSMKGRTD